MQQSAGTPLGDPPSLAGRRPPPCGRPRSRFFCEQLPEGVNLQVALGQEPLESGVLLLEASLSPQFGDSHAPVAASPAVEGVHGDAVVTAELADGLFTDLGLPEDVDDLRLAEPALAIESAPLPGRILPIPVVQFSGGRSLRLFVRFSVCMGPGQARDLTQSRKER